MSWELVQTLKKELLLPWAILEDLRLRQVKTMATTHYPELKAYGIETDWVENASMEFDTDSLRPTYRFMQGVPAAPMPLKSLGVWAWQKLSLAMPKSRPTQTAMSIGSLSA